MEALVNNVIVISSSQQLADFLAPFMQPVLQRIDRMEAAAKVNYNPLYSETEAAKYLKCSKKKLQLLRNKRKIGFIRGEGARNILYKHEHIMEYLAENELKKKS